MSHRSARSKTPPVRVTDLDQLSTVQVAERAMAGNGENGHAHQTPLTAEEFGRMSLEKKTDKLFEMIQTLMPLVEKVNYFTLRPYFVYALD